MQLDVFPEHFDRALAPDVARRLFKTCVNLVEIETFTFCNRKCWFCPNSIVDRRSTNHYMDPALYARILADLASIDYDRKITFSRYNEPLADRVILDHLRQARAALPKVTLLTHTNGDYLHRAYLDDLRAAGLNILRVQVYLGNDDRYDDGKINIRMYRRLTALGLPFQFVSVQPGIRHSARIIYDGMEVTFDARNFDLIGTDRGQLIQLGQPYQRASPCFVPFHNVYIDYNGSIVPCCNIRSDVPAHRPYVVDSLAAEGGGRSIFEAYANSPLADWRRNLFAFGPKQAPCDTCRYDVQPDNPALAAQLESFAAGLPHPPVPAPDIPQLVSHISSE
jgi:hypothetical protein